MLSHCKFDNSSLFVTKRTLLSACGNYLCISSSDASLRDVHLIAGTSPSESRLSSCNISDIPSQVNWSTSCACSCASICATIRGSTYFWGCCMAACALLTMAALKADLAAPGHLHGDFSSRLRLCATLFSTAAVVASAACWDAMYR